VQNETPAGCELAPETAPTAQTGAGGGSGSRWSGPRVRANACLISLVGTAITGLLLHGQADGDVLVATSGSDGGSSGFQVLHVVFAMGFVASVGWHLVDKRRSLLAFAKRRSGKSLRCLLANTALAALVIASLITGFAGEGPSQVAHHMAVSIVLVAACEWHGVRRIVRRRRTGRRVRVQVQL
jgi:hypothetical protein